MQLRSTRGRLLSSAGRGTGVPPVETRIILLSEGRLGIAPRRFPDSRIPQDGLGIGTAARDKTWERGTPSRMARGLIAQVEANSNRVLRTVIEGGVNRSGGHEQYATRVHRSEERRVGKEG